MPHPSGFRRHVFSIAFALGLAAILLPIATTAILPFHDLGGLVGLSGALARLDDEGARIRDFYDIDVSLVPSALYFGWGVIWGWVGMSVESSFRLFLAIFCLAGPIFALWFLLRTVGRPQALVFLAFPFAYHHQIWFGFLGSSAGVAGLIVALAFAIRVRETPTLANHMGLAGAILFVATAHPFSLALTLLVVGPALVLPNKNRLTRPERMGRIGGRLLCLIPTLVFLGGWARGFFLGGVTAAEIGTTLTTAHAPPPSLATIIFRIQQQLRPAHMPGPADVQTFLTWLGGGYTSAWDDLIPTFGLACLGIFLIKGVRCAVPATSHRALLTWACACLAIGFLFLPDKLTWPNLWWGVRFRCAIPLVLLAIAAVPIRPRGLSPGFTGPAWAVGMGFAAFVAWDFHSFWKPQVLRGFDQTIAHIPPGSDTLMILENPDVHYTLGHPYLIQYQVARRGGRATPLMRGHPGSYWITPKEPANHPPWGDIHRFSWDEHSRGFDHFLVETPMGKPEIDPLRMAPFGSVTLVFEEGRFRLYRKTRRPEPL